MIILPESKLKVNFSARIKKLPCTIFAQSRRILFVHRQYHRKRGQFLFAGHTDCPTVEFGHFFHNRKTNPVPGRGKDSSI